MKLEELTALYSSLDIEYSQAMSGLYEDLSFRSDEITIIAGLKDGRISGFWRPVVAVGDERLQKLHIERLFDICRNITYMDFLIDGKLSVISQFLLRHGHKARPYYTQIIDLTKSKEELHADLRKSYKSLINNDYDSCCQPQGLYLPEYQQLHEKASGKQIRTQNTWSIQLDMLIQNKAYLVMQRGDVAGALIYFNDFCCYYASGKSLANVNMHAVIWYAIMEAWELGCKSFELGEQVFSGDEKLINISKFKRGFGGITQTRLILEKEQ